MSQNDDIITVWKVNGKEFTFDVLDAEQSEKLEAAIAQLADEEKIAKVGKQSEIIRRYCAMFKHFFDCIFGDGAHKEIGVIDNVRVCNRIYFDFLNFVNAQKEAEKDLANKIHSTFLNRQQKRAAIKQSKGKK